MTPYPYLLETTTAHLERERMEEAARYRLLRDARRRQSDDKSERPAARSFVNARAVVALLRRTVRPLAAGAGQRRTATTDAGLGA